MKKFFALLLGAVLAASVALALHSSTTLSVYEGGNINYATFGVSHLYTDGYDAGIDLPKNGKLFLKDLGSNWNTWIMKAPTTLYQTKEFRLKYNGAGPQAVLTWNTGELTSNFHYYISCPEYYNGRVFNMKMKNWLIINSGTDGDFACTITMGMT
ncbi:hypothetical protein JW968_04555 [Candidatus Woesearchaeota archaeon]|nr:hypothetical protein [Candidatus Woesearchaeota archaeon]